MAGQTLEVPTRSGFSVAFPLNPFDLLVDTPILASSLIDTCRNTNVTCASNTDDEEDHPADRLLHECLKLFRKCENARTNAQKELPKKM